MFLLVGALSLIYVVKRINWLLIEKDEELRYRSLRYMSKHHSTVGFKKSEGLRPSTLIQSDTLDDEAGVLLPESFSTQPNHLD